MPEPTLSTAEPSSEPTIPAATPVATNSTTLPDTINLAPTPPSGANRWWFMAVVVVALAILGIAGWFIFQLFNARVNTDHADHMEMSPSVHQIVHVRQKLIVGTDTNFEPMEFLDPTSHDRVGFDIDLGKAIAQELNVPAEFVTVDFDSIFAPQNLGKANDLTSGKVDILLDSVTITAERQKHYLFSEPYINVGQVAVTKTGNNTITAKSNLANRRIAVAPNTSNETLAKTLTADANILRFEDPKDQAAAVIDGRADAMLVDLTNAKGVVNNHPQLKIATEPFTEEFYGAVISKNKQDLLAQINQILETLKQRGILESLQQKWFE